MNLWRVRVLVVLLALRAVLQLLPADVADAERHAVETALLFVPETARVLATAGVPVVVVIYVQVVLVDALAVVADVLEGVLAVQTRALKAVLRIAILVRGLVLGHVRIHVVRLVRITVLVLRLATAADAEHRVAELVLQLAPVNAKMTVTKHVPALALEHVTIHVLTVAQVDVIIHVWGLVLVDARIRVRAVEALALTIVRDALAAVLVVVLVLDAPRVPALALAAMDVVTNALLRASSLAPDVPGAVPAVHRAVQAVNPLVVTLVPERAVMAALTHAVRVALPVQRIVLQTAERLARAHATEA